jgi:hypothetical protein
MNRRQQQLEQAIAARRVLEIPGLIAAMTEHERRMDALAAQPLLPSEKQKRRAAAEQALRQALDALREQARAQHLRPFDRQEGELRARERALGADATDAQVRSQVARTTRAQLLASQVAYAGTDAAIRQVFDEALLSGDEDVIRTVGLAAQQRHRALSAEDAGRTIGAKRDAAMRFEAAFGAWQREHPSVVQQLAEIDRQRGNTAQLFEASTAFALALYGVGQPAAPPALKPLPEVESAGDGLDVGPAFRRAQQ